MSSGVNEEKKPRWLLFLLFFIIIAVVSMLVIFIVFFDQISAKNAVENVGNHILIIGAVFSFGHIKSRADKFKDNERMYRYFSLMILFFIPIIIFGIINVLNLVLGLRGFETIFKMMNAAIPSLVFNLYGREQWRVTMPFDSIFMFCILITAILAFLYPIETYVKENKRPYHSISILLCLACLPLLFVRHILDIEMVASILTTVVILVVLINFLYLFWTYFSVAIKSPKSMRNGGLLIAVGLILIFMVWASSWISLELSDIDWLRTAIPFSIAFGSIICINYGFYILRPID